jgi:hypothetical protein
MKDESVYLLDEETLVVAIRRKKVDGKTAWTVQLPFGGELAISHDAIAWVRQLLFQVERVLEADRQDSGK